MAASEDRTALGGHQWDLVNLMSRKATSAQWAEWLRAPLEHAVAEGDKGFALRLLKAGANGGAGWKGCDERSLLDAAADGGNEDVVRALLKAGGSTDLNAVSGANNMTALLRACKGGHIAAAQALLIEGADVSLVDSDQRSALHYALQGGHQELAGNLLMAGADVNAKDHAGDTPLRLAAALKNDRLVCTLLRRGACVDVANSKGEFALHAAVEQGVVSSAQALLNAGADPNVRYTGKGPISNRYSPLYLARGNSKMTKVLLQHGADLKSQDSIGYTALHWAAEWGVPSVIDALVEGGADLEAPSSGMRFHEIEFKGWAPLHTAAGCKFEAMATLLLKGANINVKDDNGLTPLHVVCKVAALYASALKKADFLLRRGADETITDNDGHTPKDLIESGSDLSEKLHRLLANAPADRRWRRRGMLVLCRARSTKVLGGGGNDGGKAQKALCRGKEAGAGAAASDPGCVLTRIVGLEIEEVFRSIVRFL